MTQLRLGVLLQTA